MIDHHREACLDPPGVNSVRICLLRCCSTSEVVIQRTAWARMIDLSTSGQTMFVLSLFARACWCRILIPSNTVRRNVVIMNVTTGNRK